MADARNGHPVGRALLVGLFSAPVAFGIGGLLTGVGPDAGRPLAAYAAVAALLGMGLAWWLVIERRRGSGGYRMLRAVQAGALGVLIAHPLTFLLPWLAGAGGVDGVAGILLLSAWSYLLVGWLTFPVGVVLGITGAWVLQRHEARRAA